MIDKRIFAAIFAATAACAASLWLPGDLWAQENGPPAQPAPAASPAPPSTSTSTPAPAPTLDTDCFPKCRNGYVCHLGTCVSLCNPPCADDEKCTPDGECVSKSPAAAAPLAPDPAFVAPSGPAPSASLSAGEQGAGTLSPSRPLTSEKKFRRPRDPRGAFLGLSVGAALCASGGLGCSTKDGDAGLHTALRGGYRFAPWVVAGLEITANPLFLRGKDGADLSLSAQIGGRFFPLQHRRRVEPVLAIGLGYALLYADDIGTTVEYVVSHGVSLTYGVGLDFNMSRTFSPGLFFEIQEPFWTKSCSRIAAAEDALTGAVSPAETSCSSYTGDRDQFFFGLGFSGSFFL